MGFGGNIGRVGGLAVALGIGSALVIGGCPTAVADSTGSSASSDKATSDNRTSDNRTSTEQSASAEQTGGESEPGTRESGGAKADDAATNDPETNDIGHENPVADIASRVRRAVRNALDPTQSPHPESRQTAAPNGNRAPKDAREESALTRPDKSHDPAPADAIPDPETEGTPNVGMVNLKDPVAVVHGWINDIPRVELSTPIRVPATKSRPALDGSGGFVEAVAAMVESALNPLSVNSNPDAPEETPAAWALLAAARREIERTVQQPTRQITSAVAEQQIETVDGPVALAPGIVVPPELSGKVTTTGPPSLMDKITVFAMEVIKRVSQFIGVNITMQLGKLITTPSPPWFTTIGLNVTKDTYEGGDVWVISRPNPTEERVIAVHGSGFVFNPNIIHWMDYAQMARETGATIVVPRYPLIPNGGTAENSVPQMADFIANEVESYGAENVSIYADSAGGTLSMLAVQKIVRDCNGDSECLENRVPSRMVLLSPGIQGADAYTDPNVALVNDPVVWLTEAEKEYYGSWAAGPEELWNPALGPTEGMPSTVFYVGSREQAAPGVLLYAARIVNANPDADISVVIGMGQIHDWAQGGYLPINSQAAKYRHDIYRQLGIMEDELT